jgi:hypothetical protein
MAAGSFGQQTMRTHSQNDTREDRIHLPRLGVVTQFLLSQRTPTELSRLKSCVGAATLY